MVVAPNSVYIYKNVSIENGIDGFFHSEGDVTIDGSVRLTGSNGEFAVASPASFDQMQVNGAAFVNQLTVTGDTLNVWNAVVKAATPPGAPEDLANKEYVDGISLTPGQPVPSVLRVIPEPQVLLRLCPDLLAQPELTGGVGPAGPGIATGGTAGQMLTKNSATNFDTAWSAAPVPTVRLVGTGTGLLGGGDLSANRTLSVDTTVVQARSEKAVANGYASLDANGKVPLVQLPVPMTSMWSTWKWLGGAIAAPVANASCGTDTVDWTVSTHLWINKIGTLNGIDWTYWITQLKAGHHVYWQAVADGTVYQRYSVTGAPVANGTNWVIPISHLTGSAAATEPANNQVVMVAFEMF